MISRLLATLVAVFLAATPTVRAFCDVSCLPTQAQSANVALPGPEHCATHTADAPSAPERRDACDHEHETSDSMFVASKMTLAPTQLAVVALAGVDVADRSSARLPIVTGVPPDAPPPTRPIPLRI